MARTRTSAHLDWVNFQVEILVFNQTVDPFGKNALQVTLTGATTGVSRHHARNRSISTKKGPKFGGSLELRGEYRLEHREEKMLFSAFVLVSIKCEHDGLEEGVDF